jgi:hypothetical protein
MPKLNPKDRIIVISACILFVVSILLNQTRSIWLSSVAALPVALMLFRPKNIIYKIVAWPTMLIVLYICVLVITELIMPEIDLIGITIDRLAGLNTRYYTFTRLLSFQLEMDAWLNGTLIFGRGLAFFSNYQEIRIIAWGHLGHVTTLAQLGLIGLGVYSFYLPITIIKSSRTLWKHATNEIKFLGLLAGTSMIWFWICFIMSNSFLAHHMVAGIIFGAVWKQARLIKSQEEKVVLTE